MAFIIALRAAEGLEDVVGDFADATFTALTLAALLTVLIDLSAFAISNVPAFPVSSQRIHCCDRLRYDRPVKLLPLISVLWAVGAPDFCGRVTAASPNDELLSTGVA
jgi:hypothetical protein